jgi:tRNA modification GTPase
VRVSGPDAKVVWDNMVRSYKPNKPIKDPIPWKLHRCHIVHPKNKSLIDDGLAVYFQGNLHLLFFFTQIKTTTAPHSYTTYPTVELHIHSGRALISALLSSLSAFPTLRPADPGEFTRQALLGGRLDLTQVEGLHDLIEADTEVQRVWALGSAVVKFFSSHIPVFSNLNVNAICRETPAQSMTLYVLRSFTV